MSTTPKVPDPPKDPDPTPQVVSQSGQEAQQAKLNAQKKAASQYGRQKTILAGMSSTDNQNKKTILGG